MFYDKHVDADPTTASNLIAASAPVPTEAPARPNERDPRRRILDATVETVAARGYDRTTISRILQSAHVEEAVFSKHFHDKHACFMQALDDLIGGAELAALEQFRKTAPWPERVRLGLQSLLRGLARNPHGARVALVEVLSAGPDARERQRSALALFTSLVEEGRSHAASSGHLAPQTSEAIVGGIASILHRRVLEGDIAELPALHKDLTYFALLPYLDHERAMAVAEL